MFSNEGLNRDLLGSCLDNQWTPIWKCSLHQCSGVGSNHALRGPQIQIVGMALIRDHNIPLLNVTCYEKRDHLG